MQINPEDLDRLRRLQSAIQMHEDSLEALQHEQERMVQERYGVDLVGETWELDLNDGTLRYIGKDAEQHGPDA